MFCLVVVAKIIFALFAEILAFDAFKATKSFPSLHSQLRALGDLLFRHHFCSTKSDISVNCFVFLLGWENIATVLFHAIYFPVAAT
jgi:hypothetical protein